jgi:hypothetical protein
MVQNYLPLFKLEFKLVLWVPINLLPRDLQRREHDLSVINTALTFKFRSGKLISFFNPRANHYYEFTAFLSFVRPAFDCIS